MRQACDLHFTPLPHHLEDFTNCDHCDPLIKTPKVSYAFDSKERKSLDNSEMIKEWIPVVY